MNPNTTALASVEPNALHDQEILFSLVMSAVAVLSCGNGLVQGTRILWVFTALLGFNLAFHRLLLGLSGSTAPLVSIGGNAFLCTLVLALSGGDKSSFWPLYLLPIFTACVHLERRHVLGACAAAGAFLSCFYLEAFWESRRWEACEFFLKLGVLGFSAAVTAQLSFKERAHSLALRASRERVAGLARALERRAASDLQAMRQQSLDSLVPAIAHALNNPLAVILGSVELMLQDAPEGSVHRSDLERVRAAARRCAQLSEDLRDYARMPAARTR